MTTGGRGGRGAGPPEPGTPGAFASPRDAGTGAPEGDAAAGGTGGGAVLAAGPAGCLGVAGGGGRNPYRPASASVTAPSSGAPTADRAAPPRPKPNPGFAVGNDAASGRATPFSSPAGQDEACCACVSCTDHSILPRSISTAYIPTPAFARNARLRNPRYPM